MVREIQAAAPSIASTITSGLCSDINALPVESIFAKYYYGLRCDYQHDWRNAEKGWVAAVKYLDDVNVAVSYEQRCAIEAGIALVRYYIGHRQWAAALPVAQSIRSRTGDPLLEFRLNNWIHSIQTIMIINRNFGITGSALQVDPGGLK